MYSVETERLILRPFITEDIAFLNFMHSDIDVTRYTCGHTRGHNENLGFINAMQNLYQRKLGHLLVFRKSDHLPIGRCGFSIFHGVNHPNKGWLYWDSPEMVEIEGEIVELIELGYSFAKPYWGNGYATEAAMALRDHAYNQLGYSHFSSLIMKGNVGSVKVANNIGACDSVDCMIEGQPSLKLRNVKNG